MICILFPLGDRVNGGLLKLRCLLDDYFFVVGEHLDLHHSITTTGEKIALTLELKIKSNMKQTWLDAPYRFY